MNYKTFILSIFVYGIVWLAYPIWQIMDALLNTNIRLALSPLVSFELGNVIIIVGLILLFNLSNIPKKISPIFLGTGLAGIHIINLILMLTLEPLIIKLGVPSKDFGVCPAGGTPMIIFLWSLYTSIIMIPAPVIVGFIWEVVLKHRYELLIQREMKS